MNFPKIMKVVLGSVAAMSAVLVMHCGEANAMLAGEINYGVLSSNPAGEVSSAGGVAPIVGKDITVADVMGLGTSSRSDSRLAIGNGRLNFVSGGYLSSIGNKDLYGGSGTFTITGNFDIDANGIVENGVTLLKGSISSLTLDRSDSFRYLITGATLTVTENALASYFGFSAGTQFAGLMDLSFNVLQSGFNGGNTSGSVIASPVPVPGSAFMLLPGMAALFGLRRKIGSGQTLCG